MATTVSSSLTLKRCQKCGKDVNGQRRMKDPRGNYWCYECGSADEASKGSGTLVQPCPLCKKPVHAMNMVRNKKTGVYSCDECASGAKASSGGSSPEAKKKMKMYMLGAVFALGGVFAWYMNQKS